MNPTNLNLQFNDDIPFEVTAPIGETKKGIIFDTRTFSGIRLSLASPDDIRSWSFGEVTKPETINYRTGRAERYGLFDERVFGPERDYECYCGKYKGIRYKDIICEKCGVEITRSIVRRERMGHIELATPVSHVWFLKGAPSRMATTLNISGGELEKVIYFAGYIVMAVYESEKARLTKEIDAEYNQKAKTIQNEETLEKLREMLATAKKELADLAVGKVLTEMQYHHYTVKYSTCFDAKIGGEAIYEMLKNLDLEKTIASLEERFEKAPSLERERLEKRLAILRNFVVSKQRPESMFIQALPVIPPALRPMVALEGGRHATSDINDLYRRVINRNNRLLKLKEIGAPDVILRNEKRILQEAVDALFDNKEEVSGINSAQKRPLKSLSDNLESKSGMFRQNLLGKRVDYSGRSVIVVGPNLEIDECGLPKHMALELFRPFVTAKLLDREYAYNIRGANRLIEDGIPEVWGILEEVIEGKYVLLNRAPTLHRLSIQAFRPRLIEGSAIQLHPMVCSGFNADFDGDQMAVHLPLSPEAQAEARELMSAKKNLLKPQNGEPVISAKMLDIALGCYWMTKNVSGEKGENKYFISPNEAITARDYDLVTYRAKIYVAPTDKKKYAAFEGKVFQTTVGKLLFNAQLPDDFPYINEEMTQKKLQALLEQITTQYDFDTVAAVADKIKTFGYTFVTYSGVTWAIDNVTVPKEKPAIVAAACTKEIQILIQYEEGLLSHDEKRRKVVELWEATKKEIEKTLPATLDPMGSVYDMVTSGARGSWGQVTQMAGMKGIIVNTKNEPIPFPIVPSYKEGLSPIEYFITTHGSRKGLADTALKTADAGYFTRKLVDMAQSVTIVEEDCGTKEGRIAKKENIGGMEISLAKKLRGRTLFENIKDSDGKILYKKGHVCTKTDADKIGLLGIEEVLVRTPLTCKSIGGVCAACYGLDLGRDKPVQLGEAVGIIAAQAIGEPGTQLTLRTFHAGGVAGADITQGLPRVIEVFEKRSPKIPAILSKTSGEVIEIKEEGKQKIIVVLSNSEYKGKEARIEYVVPVRRLSAVVVGQKVEKGDLLTDGSADIADLFNFAGAMRAQDYIIHEINKVYELQGAPISPKHLEIIVRQMFSRRKVREIGTTRFIRGDIVEQGTLTAENSRVESEGGIPARADIIIMGLTQVALSTESWLSSASFQNTSRILINASLKGSKDPLRGLKENVIIGRLVPAGTGFRGSLVPSEDDNTEDELILGADLVERKTDLAFLPKGDE
jgi:DNA-directed RNA polymerase subunit beta'